jgi:hypothetical protein
MTKYPQAPIAMLLCAVMLLVPAFTSAQTPQPAANNALRIVVISGEDAINIIQQKTAVNPIVEVRDRNNLPVSGVAVTFNVGGQGASFAGGASTLTVTTNAAGQAVVTGLTPTAAGSVTINATAVVNGQSIAATITQTNFATAAEAASAASSAGGASGSGGGATGGGTSGAAGGAGGAGGGISGTTLGIIGGVGAAAAGGLAAASGGGSDSPATSTGTSGNTGTGSAPTGPAAPSGPSIGGTYNGTINGSFTSTGTSTSTGIAPISCTSTYSVTGPIRVVLNNTTDGSASGTGTVDATFRETATTCTVPGLDLSPDGQPFPFQFTGPVTGNSSSLRFTQDITQNQNIQGAQVNSRITSTFTGSISGNSMTGTVTMTSTSSVTITVEGFTITGTGTGTGTMPATLSK